MGVAASGAGFGSRIPIDVMGGRTGNDSTDSAVAGRVVEANCAETSVVSEDETVVKPADIVFAIDGSWSMAVEIGFVRAQMNRFSQKITDSGIDVHVIVIAEESIGEGDRGMPDPITGATVTGICIDAPLGSGVCPQDTKLPHYAHVKTLVRSNDSLDILISSYPSWKQYLRSDASKSLVVVTDDDASLAATAFMASFKALDPELLKESKFHGVFCFSQCEEAASVGSVYRVLVEETGGVSGDLCLQDFAPVFERLAEQVVHSSSRIACEWEVPPPPNNRIFASSLVEVKRVDSSGAAELARVAYESQCGADGGWHFDSNMNPTRIVACPRTCESLQGSTGGRIDIVYACESVGSCVSSDSSPLSIRTCMWEIPKPPTGKDLSYGNVNVRYTSATGLAMSIGKVTAVSDCAMVEQGWYYDDPSHPDQVVACPQTCEQIQAGGEEGRLDVLFGCTTTEATPLF